MREQTRLIEGAVEERTRVLSSERAAAGSRPRKDNFLANVSHELRSPLVTMIGYTELLLPRRWNHQRAPAQCSRLRARPASACGVHRGAAGLLALRAHAGVDELHPSTARRGDAALAGLAPVLERRLNIRQRVPTTRPGAGRPRPHPAGPRQPLSNAERHCRRGKVSSPPAAARFVLVSVQDNAPASGAHVRDLRPVYQSATSRTLAPASRARPRANIVKSMWKRTAAKCREQRSGQGLDVLLHLPLSIGRRRTPPGVIRRCASLARTLPSRLPRGHARHDPRAGFPRTPGRFDFPGPGRACTRSSTVAGAPAPSYRTSWRASARFRAAPPRRHRSPPGGLPWIDLQPQIAVPRCDQSSNPPPSSARRSPGASLRIALVGLFFCA